MNILHHKSWHVRNKDNIERVRRDEENARLEEEKKAKRAALAEQEARTALLRDRAKGSQSKEITNDRKSSSSTGSELVPVSDQQKHINFFQDIEEGLKQGTNPEYEAEKKAEQEKQEKAIGLLTYLGQSASEKHSDRPWYLKKDHQKKTTDDKNSRDMKRKDSLDPLNSMKKYLEAREKHKHKNKKHKREYKHHKSRKAKKKEETSPKKKSIQELRAERLKREHSERIRESEVYSSSRGEKKASEPVEDNPYRYNSQFNPDLVRKPHSSHRYRPY